MQLTKTIPLATLLLSAPFAAADDLGHEDVPRACTEICRPIRQLVRQCDVDDDRVGGDRNEDRLERHCVCTNDSFDVARVAGLCQSCIDEHWDDGCVDSDSDDDDDDVDECDDGRKAMRKIMRACNFSSVDYDSQATSTDVTVSASPYTDVAQLTSATTSTNARETNSDGDDNSSSDDRNSNEMDRGSDNQDDGDDDDNAAGKAAMPGMAALVGLVAAGALM